MTGWAAWMKGAMISVLWLIQEWFLWRAVLVPR